MSNNVFTNDYPTKKELVMLPRAAVENSVRVITDEVSSEAIKKGDAFAKEITERFLSNFEKNIGILPLNICESS